VRYRVEFSPEALAHAQVIRQWWVANRPRAPQLFLHELRAAVMQLRRAPLSGRPYEAVGVRPTRRLLLPKTHFHLYHWLDETTDVVRIYAVWHSARGEGPPLP
jgi:plasmid stabilization system protein ParE